MLQGKEQGWGRRRRMREGERLRAREERRRRGGGRIFSLHANYSEMTAFAVLLTFFALIVCGGKTKRATRGYSTAKRKMMNGERDADA